MIRKIFIWFLCGFLVSQAYSQEYRTVKDLEGQWKFSLGNNEQWSVANYDDSNWETIAVPSPWERQGFNGYDGYAWYRKGVKIESVNENEELILELGYIDDADEVYFNGVKIGGAGSFPPHPQTAYNALREYNIPNNLIHGDVINTIAIKVFDSQLDGGIVRGPVRIKSYRNPFKLYVDLQGEWDFRIGDNLDWRFSDTSEEWEDILVPGIWENQRYRSYDGYAWYQKVFVPDHSFTKDRMVLILGHIDDIDAVYFNGILIGQTGSFEPAQMQRVYSQAYQQLRAYLIPDFLVQPEVKNTIHVRVVDFGGEGGIIEGPVGIMKQQDYIQYWRDKKRNRY